MLGFSHTLGFSHLHAHSAFSFLDSSATVQDLVLRAAEMGQPALALTDTNSVTGIPSLVKLCAKAGVKPIGGCEIAIDGHRLTLLADGQAGWTTLCQILTAASLRDVKRQGAVVQWEDLEAHHDGLVCLSGCSQRGRTAALVRAKRYSQAEDYARRCLSLFGAGNFFIEVSRTLSEGEHEVSCRLMELAEHLSVPPVVTNPVHHAGKMGVAAWEILCRVRLGLAPEEEHPELPFNGEQYIKSQKAMIRLFADRPDVLQNAAVLAERLEPPLTLGVRHLPKFPHIPPGESAFSFLAVGAWGGAEKRYKIMSGEVQTRLVHELETIRDLGYCDYFLVCADICNEARRRGIGHAMRGSAVGSAVCYVLGMSEHDPIARNVSFERFLSKGRAKPPDIDIDFQHDLRDDMMNYVRDTYGHDKVANVSNYITFRARSLLRDLGKVMGFDTSEIDRLRELLGYSRGNELAAEIDRKPELREIGIDVAQYADLFALCAQLSGLPRHLGTHSSGIVVSDVPLAGLIPLYWAAKGVTVVAADKNDAEDIGLLKIDQLSLRALTAIQIATQTLAAEEPGFNYAGRDREDPETLAMIRAAQTVTAFQLESPAQMALQRRLKADKFDDLVASVALIRPGPLLGKTVQHYIARRHGQEPVIYPLPELEPILSETYGRILFQDQVLDVVRIIGNLNPDEADKFQKAITHARNKEEMARLGLDLYEKVKARGMTKNAFASIWKQIVGFASYGFCHGHSVAFADHAQGTAWLLCHHPAEFLAAVLSVEPCGFWPVNTVVSEAQRRGVKVHGPCVNRSEWQRWALEDGGAAIRCSLSYVQELARAGAVVVEERRLRGQFASLEDFCSRCHFLSREQVEWLTLAGALDCLTFNRRQTLWSLPLLHRESHRKRRGINEHDAEGQTALDVPIPVTLSDSLADFDFHDRYWKEWSALGFSPLGHPVQFVRDALSEQGVAPCASLQDAKAGQKVTLAGIIIRVHKPPTAGGCVFFSLEDETALVHVTVLPDAYQRIGAAVYGAGIVVVEGRAERRGEGVTLLVEELTTVR